MTLRLFGFLLLVALATTPTSAWAQGGGDTQTAVTLAKAAKAKYDQGDWQGALELFEAAEAKAHSPVLLLYAARCNRNLGKLVRAREQYRAVTLEALGPNASAPFLAAQKDAADDLEALEARIPTIVIDRTQAPAAWEVSIDDVVTVLAQTAVDPGPHVVRARLDGVVQFEQSLTLAEGKSETVTIAAAKPSAPAPTSRPEPLPEPDRATGSDPAALAPGLTVLGVGVAAAAVGVGLRIAALETVSDVKDRCLGQSCLAEDLAEVERAETFQTVSTVLFVAGGAAAAAGVVLLIVLPSAGEAQRARLELRPGYVGLSGTF